jgi:hypothetical protein
LQYNIEHSPTHPACSAIGDPSLALLHRSGKRSLVQRWYTIFLQ